MLTLVIGDKNLSSWSLRPWILLRHLGLPFTELRLPLDTPQFRAEIVRWSPTGRVPVLIDGDLRVWDSIAICEYASEQAGGIGWPAGAAARAVARSISA
jgi:glutathione S-transferase